MDVKETDGGATSAGTAAPVLTPSTEVETVKPFALATTGAPVVNSPAANVIIVAPKAATLPAVVQIIESVPAFIAQLSVGAMPKEGTSTPAGADLAVK